MLAELAAANAAFDIIRTALKNSNELATAAGGMADFFNAKSTLQRKSKRKGTRSQMEAFVAMQQIKDQENKLREWFIYESGRPHLWKEWLQFQADAKKARAKELHRRKIQRDKDRAFHTKWIKAVFSGVSSFATLLLSWHYYL